MLKTIWRLPAIGGSYSGRVLPPYATTGVGSLPHADPVAAVRHVLGAYELPFCPQLPRAEGDMVREWLGGEPPACGWSPDRDRERPVAWDAFVAAVRAAPPAHGLVKLQVTGPATLATALEGPGDAGLAREIATWLAANAAGQVARLREAGLGVILLVDEPSLASAGVDDADVWGPLRLTGASAWGLHVCGPVPWRLADALEPDVVSFDLARHGLDADGAAVLRRVVERGGRVAWGVLDPVAPDGAPAASARVTAAIGSLGLPAGQVAAGSLITPACGTGLLTTADEELLAATLAGLTPPGRAPGP
jgi:hypothetical protein